MKNTTLFVDHIMVGLWNSGQRPGQYLFNHLPEEVQDVVAWTFFDPFYKVKTDGDVYQWIEDHLIFNKNAIIGVFNNNQLLWEAPNTNFHFEPIY